MELIDRYLSAVGVLLPSAERADIIAELRDALMSRREEKEAELGRPLTRAEDEALLKDFGHPLLVAGRYGRRQYLIGPELYPLYIFALRIVLAIVVASAVISGIVNAVIQPSAPGAAVAAGVNVAWTGFWAALGAVTFVVAMIERSRVRLKVLDDWSVRDLPEPTKRPRRAAWFDHVAAIVVQGVFLLWWARVIQLWQPHIPLKNGQGLAVALGPVWQGLYWPVVALSVGMILVHATRLLASASRRLGYVLDLPIQAATLGLAGYLLRAGDWVIVSGQGASAEAVAKIRFGIDTGLTITFIAISIVAAVTLAYDVWRLWRPAPEAVSAP